MAESPNSITVKVTPDMVSAMESVKALIVDHLLRYSEWLDCEGLMRPVDETGDRMSSTHDELVRDFLSET